MRIETILILDQVTDDLFDRSGLIVSNCRVYRVLVIKLDAFRFSFFKLVLVEYWVFFAEQARVLFIKK